MMTSINATTPASGADGRGSGAYQEPAPSPGKAAAGARETPGGKPASDLRLTIEEDKHTGVFLYRLTDAVTGVLINEIPRHQVLAMADEPSYAAGGVVQTRA